MKTARQRAEEFIRKTYGSPTNIPNGHYMVEQLTLSFKEHARDQRHLCAEAEVVVDGLPHNQYHNVIMNTRAPGE